MVLYHSAFLAIVALVQLKSIDGRLSTSSSRTVRAHDTQLDFSMPTEVVEPEQITPTSSKEVCIIGGGPSGTYAAHLLQERGYDVALFEKASMLGGKTVPYQQGVNMFRHVLTDDMILVKSLIEEFGLEDEGTTRGNENVCSDEEPYTITAMRRDDIWENMALGLDRPGLGMETVETALATARYTALWNEYKDVILQPNLVDVPEELMKGAGEWLADNGVLAISKHPGL